MILKNWWEKDLKDNVICPKLSKHIKTDYLVVGGGIAGLHAALYLKNQGKKVVLLEKSYCGGSSSGKSSGFLTPSSELGLSEMINRYGLKDAKIVWEIPVLGVEEMANNVRKYKIDCDFEPQNCLFLGSKGSGEEKMKDEALASKKMQVKYKYYDKKALGSILNTNSYTAGVATYGTYSINSRMYCKGLKKILMKKHVRVFENSEVLKISESTVHTLSGSVEAKKIIFCVDKPKPELNPDFARKVYHAQTFLTISEKMTEKEIKSVFPKGKFMCWNSKLVYDYFKITKDDRLLLGGSSLLAFYSPNEFNSDVVVRSMIKRFKKQFPQLERLKFVAYWPGLIDIAKDIMPIVDFDRKNKNVQYVLGNPGLPWAAFLGTYAAKRALGTDLKHLKKYERYIKANRKFFISDQVQRVIGKMPSFAVNNFYAQNYQVDKEL